MLSRFITRFTKPVPALACACIVLFAVAVSAYSQTPTPTPTPGPTAVATASPSPSPVAAPRVVKVEGNLELDDLVRVQIDNLSEWAKHNDASKLVPFINGRSIHGDYPEEIHASKNQLLFHLELTPENRGAWVDLLGEPPGARRPVSFSVGLENRTPFDSVYDQNNRIPLTVISPVYGVVSFVVVLITLILLVWLARTTNLLRDPGPCPVAGMMRPYNLGRTQMAFWFFLVYASYTTIWLITGALDTITQSLLGLMGISAGTALGEALIDSGKTTASSDQIENLTAQKQGLEKSIPELQAQIASVNAKAALTPEDTANRDSLNKQLQDSRTHLGEVTQHVQSLTPPDSSLVSKGLLRDLLSDGSGYSFHRFQIFAWTIVLGIMFVSSVYNSLAMPEFSATLLGLMGISSGTYIGFKFPEQK